MTWAMGTQTMSNRILVTEIKNGHTFCGATTFGSYKGLEGPTFLVTSTS
jgi:hypothetical protein